MQQVNILDATDVQDQINESLTAWGVWAQMVEERLLGLEEQNRRQNKRINALSDRVTALEEKVADPDFGLDTYTDTY